MLRHPFLNLIWILFSIATAEDCALTMWVYESLTRCDSTEPPNAVGTLYADGKCRAIDGVEPSSPDYNLFPNYYTASCTRDGKLRIENSGCVSDTCAPGPFGVCEADTSVPGHLFSRFATPEYTIQQQSAGYYTCFRLQGSVNNPISVTFVIFGDCTTPACQQHVAPIVPNLDVAAPAWPTFPGTPFANAPTGPISTPLSAPFTWRPYTPMPTLPPPPSARPTMRPTRSPVTVPTTLEPTTLPPSSGPTFQPTSYPTLADTFTKAPVPNVFLSETITSRVGLHLLEMGGTMNGEILNSWITVTAAHIKNSVSHILNAAIENVDQEEANLELSIQFDLAVEYIAGSFMDVEELFAQAFDEETERISYVLDLVARNATEFGSLEKISVEGALSVSPVTVQEKSRSPTGVLIASITSVSLSLIAGICIVIYLFRRKLDSVAKAQRLPDTHEDMSTSQAKEVQKYTNEILVDTEADDVSTLGGSVLNTANATTVGDEPTASVNLDYDFEKKQYIIDSTDTTIAFSAVSKSHMPGDSVFEDDDISFEQQYADASNHVKRSFRPFEVNAPAGLLGMVVDTPGNTGIPVVRAIKPDSVLAGQIQIGDRLIAVDHEDVTKMNAMAVSNLISLKQNQQRVLVFVRVV